MKNHIKTYDLFINEGRQVDPYNDINAGIPIKDDDVIRAYHGFNNIKDAVTVLKYGLSGKEKARRIYSYESGNNPIGLFVSVILKTIIHGGFGNGSGTIIEFNTKVKDLESPVWAGQDSYYVQGQYTKSFKNEEERKLEILRKREIASKSEYDAISRSDRPELAYMLLESPEKQALYIGDLNPNMIKAVWVNEELMLRRRHGKPWVRMSLKEYLKRYEKDVEFTIDDSHLNSKRDKIFKPNDNLDMEVLNNFIKNCEYCFHPHTNIKNILLDKYHLKNLKDFLWPKQIEQLKKIL